MSDFAYFQEQDSEQFSFFRIPKILFSDERFRNLSSEAKILYGLMLDRVGLSRKNGWVDAEGNVYIHFTIEEMMSVLKWSRYRIFQLLDELDEKEPGIGLIERRRVGHCNEYVNEIREWGLTVEELREIRRSLQKQSLAKTIREKEDKERNDKPESVEK